MQVSAQLAYVRKTQEELGRERCSVTAGADWRQPAVQRAALAHEAARLLHALKDSIAAAIRGGASAQAAWNAHLVEVGIKEGWGLGVGGGGRGSDWGLGWRVEGQPISSWTTAFPCPCPYSLPALPILTPSCAACSRPDPVFCCLLALTPPVLLALTLPARAPCPDPACSTPGVPRQHDPLPRPRRPQLHRGCGRPADRAPRPVPGAQATVGPLCPARL